MYPYKGRWRSSNGTSKFRWMYAVYDSWPSAEGGDDDDFNFKISVSDQFKLATRPNGAEARHFVMQMLEEHDEVELGQ